MKRRSLKVSLLIFTLMSTLVVCEVVYRWMLFGGHARFANLRSSRRGSAVGGEPLLGSSVAAWITCF